MAILNYTTKIAYDKTISEIQKCLVSHGASKVVTDYAKGMPTAITFGLQIDGNMIAFAMPFNHEGVLLAMKKDRKVPQALCTKEQALRVSLRIIKDWIEAQMAIVEANLVTVDEVFLPYAITKSGNTLYQEMKGNNLLMLRS